MKTKSPQSTAPIFSHNFVDKLSLYNRNKIKPHKIQVISALRIIVTAINRTRFIAVQYLNNFNKISSN